MDRPVAAKTGSSSDNKSAQFVGFTPQVVTAVTLYQTGTDGSEESIEPWGEYDEITLVSAQPCAQVVPLEVISRLNRDLGHALWKGQHAH